MVANAPVNGPPLALTPNVSTEYNLHQDATGVDTSRIGQPNVYVSLRTAQELAEVRGGGGKMYQSQGNPQLSRE
jgi:hypothetical protein